MSLRDSLGDPANGSDFIDDLDDRFNVIWNGTVLHMTSPSGTDAYTATITPAVTSYANGMVFSIVWPNANTSSTVTLNSLPVVKADGSSLPVGAIEADMTSFLVVVDGEFRIMSPLGAGGEATSYYYTFTTTGAQTFTLPTGLRDDQFVLIEAWAGGSGGHATGGGGGGGAYARRMMRVSEIGASVTVTVGAGGAVGSSGGNTTFGSFLTAYRGSRGDTSRGGGGGGSNETGSGVSGGYWGGGNGASDNGLDPDIAGSDAAGEGGGGGGFGTYADGYRAVYGGGGGAASGGSGGVSKFGGNGGDSGVAGSAPGGGGGRNAAGARGEVRVWIYA